MRRTSIVAPLIAVAAAIGGGCTNVSTDLTRAVAIAFDSLPFPAVVNGDTLRDSLGKAMPLRAVAFNSSGARMPGAVIQYLALDTGLTIDAGGIVTAQRQYGPVRVVASVNGLQSIQQTLQVARRPDTLSSTVPTDTMLAITSPDNGNVNVTSLLRVKLETRLPYKDSVKVTRGWLVSYQVFLDGNALSPADTTTASLLGAGTTVTAMDTTKEDGTAGRRLRVRNLLAAGDDLVVVATARYRGVPVSSPVRFKVFTVLKK